MYLGLFCEVRGDVGKARAYMLQSLRSPYASGRGKSDYMTAVAMVRLDTNATPPHLYADVQKLTMLFLGPLPRESLGLTIDATRVPSSSSFDLVTFWYRRYGLKGTYTSL